MKYSSAKILALLSIIKNAQLEAPIEFLNAEPEELRAVCNGVGSADLPKSIRKILTKAFRCAEASASIHDWQFHHSDGLKHSLKKANDLFLANALLEVRYWRSAWWQLPLRIWEERKVIIAYRTLEKCSAGAFALGFCRKVNGKGSV